MSKYKVGDVVCVIDNNFVIESVRELDNGHVEYEGTHKGDSWTLYEQDVCLVEKEKS